MKALDHANLDSTEATSVHALLSDLTCSDPSRVKLAALRAESMHDPSVLDCLLHVSKPRDEPAQWRIARLETKLFWCNVPC